MNKHGLDLIRECRRLFCDSGISQRTAEEDRRHAVRQLVMAARLAEARLRELGQEAMADTLRVAIKGMRP